MVEDSVVARTIMKNIVYDLANDSPNFDFQRYDHRWQVPGVYANLVSKKNLKLKLTAQDVEIADCCTGSKNNVLEI